MAKASSKEARNLASQSSDCSFLLTHMIRQNSDRTDEEASSILKAILEDDPFLSPTLRSSDVGWYSSISANIFNPKTSSFEASKNSKAVCFTESTLAGLRAHRDIFKVKYGISFDRDDLFRKGANPCLNIRSDIFKQSIKRKGESIPRHLYNFIPIELHPYVNIIHAGFDATHEREWRFAGDMEFNIKEVKFLFCPEEDFEQFSDFQNKGLPTLFDLKWLDRI